MAEESTNTATAPAETSGGAEISLAANPVASPVPPAAEAPKDITPTPLKEKPVEATKPSEASTDAKPEKLDALLAEKPEAQKSPEGEPQKQAPEGDTKEEGSQSEPAPLPTYEITFPEEFKADKEELDNFTKTLGEFESGPKDRDSFNKLAQDLVNRHVDALKKTSEKINEKLMSDFEATKLAWREEIKKDSQLGGNRFDTVILNANRAISTYGGTPEQQSEFRKLVISTGVENHPAMIRFLNNIVEARPAPKSVPGTKPVPTAKRKTPEIMYGTNK